MRACSFSWSYSSGITACLKTPVLKKPLPSCQAGSMISVLMSQSWMDRRCFVTAAVVSAIEQCHFNVVFQVTEEGTAYDSSSNEFARKVDRQMDGFVEGK